MSKMCNYIYTEQHNLTKQEPTKEVFLKTCEQSRYSVSEIRAKSNLISNFDSPTEDM